MENCWKRRSFATVNSYRWAYGDDEPDNPPRKPNALPIQTETSPPRCRVQASRTVTFDSVNAQSGLTDWTLP